MALLVTLALIAPTPTHGPMLGAADETSLEFWARASQPGEYSFELFRTDHSYLAPIVCKAEEANDLTLHWRVEGLEPGQVFGCRIRCGETDLVNIGYHVFNTQPAQGHGSASLAFASGCDERDALLRWIGEHKIGGVVLVRGGAEGARVIVHPSTALAGYDVPEFSGAPSAFLWVQAQRYESGSQFVGRIVDASGKEFELKAFQLSELSAAPSAKAPAPR